MKIRTIEIQQTDVKKNKELIEILGRIIPKGMVWHFFYEPKLIIRIDYKNVKALTDYLKIIKLKYKVYDYPFPKKGYGQGSKKKDVVTEYLSFFYLLFYINSKLAIERNKKKDGLIIERYTHTFLNVLGYDYTEESLEYIKLAYGRVGVIRKYDARNTLDKLWCSMTMKVLKIGHWMTKKLQYV